MNTGILGGNRSHIGRESYLGVNEKNYRKGFTLVELIVVLVILAILAAIAVPVTLGFIDKAREKEFVGNAEISLSATQAVLNDVYNDGLGYLPITKRIEAYNAAQAGNIENNGEITGFKIWTKSPLIHGTTHATNNEIASFKIAKALFISDGRAAVYDGKEWKYYDDEEDAKAACQGFGREIVIWPVELAYTDDAYNPANLVQEEVELGVEEIVNQTSMLTVRILSVENVVSLDKIPQTSGTIVGDVDLVDSADRIQADLEAKINGYTATIDKHYVQHEEQIGWAYEYTTPSGTGTGYKTGTLMSVAKMVADIKDSLKAEGATDIKFTPSVSPKRVTVRVAFGSAGLLTVSGEEKDYLYNIVTGEMVAPDLDDIEVGNTSNSVKFAGNWAVENGESYDFLPLSSIGAYANSLAVAAAAGYENNDFDDPINVTFLAAADIEKKVYLSDKKTGNAFSGKVTFNNSSKILAATVTKNELQDTVKIGNQVIGQYTYKKNDAGEITDTSFAVSNSYNLLNGAGMQKASESLKTKWWFIYDSNADGVISSTTDYDKTRDDNPTVAVFERLYAPDNNNMGEVAEVDLSAINALLLYTDNLTSQSPIIQKLYYLAGGNSTVTIDANSTNGQLKKIDKIEYKTGVKTPPSTDSIYREVCLSVTEIPTGSNGFLKRKDNGEYDINDDDRDPEYPNYIVAYSVKKGDGSFDIYVFAEDDTEMKARGSLQAMFACCEAMASNTMVDHMNTEGIISTHLMFYNCKNLQSLSLGNIDTTSATKMSYMFKNCEKLNPEGGLTIRIDSATTIQNMFEGCKALTNITLEGNYTKNGNQENPLGNGSVGTVFTNSGLTTLCLRNLNFTEFEQAADQDTIRTTGTMTHGLHSLVSNAIAVGKLDSITFDNVRAEEIYTTRELFKGASKLTKADLSGLILPNNTSFRNMFNGCKMLTDVDLGSQLADTRDSARKLNAASMFNTCNALTGLDKIKGLDNYFDHIKYFDWMFENCIGFTECTINIKTAASMEGMLKGCINLQTVTLDGHDGAKDLVTIKEVFMNCNNLENVTVMNIKQDSAKLTTLTAFAKDAGENLTISNVTVPGITSAKEMFNGCTKLKTANVEINSKLTSLQSMFQGCGELEEVTLKVTWDQIVSMENMFYKDTNLNKITFNGDLNMKSLNTIKYIVRLDSNDANKEPQKTAFRAFCATFKTWDLRENTNAIFNTQDSSNLRNKITELDKCISDMEVVNDYDGYTYRICNNKYFKVIR